MNTLADPPASAGAPPVALRPEAPGDEPFLFTVYASTREEELALTNWDESMRLAFLQHQFQAMRQGFRTMYPAGEFSIVLFAGQPVGRMVLHRGPAEIRVVDLALLPARRNQGVGTWLMREVCREAARAAKRVTLCVLQNNRALHWYARLGFTPAGPPGVYAELAWDPAPAVQAGA